MANKTLSFDTGVVDYTINDTVTVRFNPTDVYFVERLYDAFRELDERQEEFQQRVTEINEDHGKLFSYAHERDAEMRVLIDGLLGEGVSDGLFPDMNCYAVADGAPIWVNLIFALAEEVNDAFQSEKKKADPRIETYTKKNAELLRKYRKATTKK